MPQYSIEYTNVYWHTVRKYGLRYTAVYMYSCLDINTIDMLVVCNFSYNTIVLPSLNSLKSFKLFAFFTQLCIWHKNKVQNPENENVVCVQQKCMSLLSRYALHNVSMKTLNNSEKYRNN